jgi:hypothetical protein
MLTDAEFTERQNEILKGVPKEFHGALSYYAYQQGHSNGNSEILIILCDLVDALEKPISDFEERIRGC